MNILVDTTPNYCPNCGQLLSWEFEEDTIRFVQGEARSCIKCGLNYAYIHTSTFNVPIVTREMVEVYFGHNLRTIIKVLRDKVVAETKQPLISPVHIQPIGSYVNGKDVSITFRVAPLVSNIATAFPVDVQLVAPLQDVLDNWRTNGPQR
jgi:hypothetical protein